MMSSRGAHLSIDSSPDGTCPGATPLVLTRKSRVPGHWGPHAVPPVRRAILNRRCRAPLRTSSSPWCTEGAGTRPSVRMGPVPSFSRPSSPESAGLRAGGVPTTCHPSAPTASLFSSRTSSSPGSAVVRGRSSAPARLRRSNGSEGRAPLTSGSKRREALGLSRRLRISPVPAQVRAQTCSPPRRRDSLETRGLLAEPSYVASPVPPSPLP